MRPKARYRLALAAIVSAAIVTRALPDASEVDAKIESLFRKGYVYRTYLRDDDIRIAVKDGVATLTGTVAEESHRMFAQDTVWSLPWISSVDNQLVTKAEVAVATTDVLIGRAVNLALRCHRNVNAGKTVVTVTDGIVTLRGEASSIAQKELTAEYTKDIAGVKEVTNEMTVALAPEPAERTAAEMVDDASVTAQVKAALRTHRSTHSVDVKIVTRDGRVSLTGIARNDAEKSLVTKLISDIRGVTIVNNEMTVAEVVTR